MKSIFIYDDHIYIHIYLYMLLAACNKNNEYYNWCMHVQTSLENI